MKNTSKSIILTSNCSEFSYTPYPPIQLEENGKHETALFGLNMYNSIPNIDGNNNVFIYDYMDIRYRIEIPEGSYEITGINEYIKNKLYLQGHQDLFEIKANLNTLKCVIEIFEHNVKIIFSHHNSLKELFGFNDDILEGLGEHESTNIVNILGVNDILVHCSVVGGSYLNNSQHPILYTFFPNVPPGYKIVEKPNSPLFLPVTLPVINSMKIWLTDQNGKILNTRGETITLKLQLRSIVY